MTRSPIREVTSEGSTAPVHSTLLALVQSLQDELGPHCDVATRAAALVNSGRVVLTGNFKGCRLELTP